jgi:hypothetical protein
VTAAPVRTVIQRGPKEKKVREFNAQGKMGRGRNWTIALLLRHTAYHELDHAWEVEDKDLLNAGGQVPDASESARGSAPAS